MGSGHASAGMRTGLVRAFGGRRGVVTTAGIVFGLTMFAMLSSDVLTNVASKLPRHAGRAGDPVSARARWPRRG
jgi:hypothetical protein